MKQFHRALVLTGALLAGGNCLAQAAPQATLNLNIEPQSVDAALNEFARQSGLQVVLQTEEVRGLTSARLAGSFTAKEALTKLLSNTGLSFEYLNERTIAVRMKAAVPASSETRGAEFQKVQLAQVEQPSASKEAGQGEEQKESSSLEEEGSSSAAKSISEVVVTGSHIRGDEGPVGTNVIVVDRGYIERSGYSSLQDILNSLPQSAPAPRPDNPNAGDQRALPNLANASGFNLHGLGAGATLVLIDGRRQAGAGLDGSFVDISSIPLSAVERVEIVPDGSSAIYGSDAIAGVVNIILKKNFIGNESSARFASKSGDGNETTLSQVTGRTWQTGQAMFGIEYTKRKDLIATDRAYSADGDQRIRGGTNFDSLNASPGNIFDFTTGRFAYAIPRNQSGENLSANQLIAILPDLSNANVGNVNFGAPIFPGEESKSAYLNFSQDLISSLRLTTRARYNDRDTSATQRGNRQIYAMVGPGNPYYVDAFSDQRPYLVFYDLGRDIPLHQSGETKTYDGMVGLDMTLGRDWKLGATISYSRQSMSFDSVNLDFAVLDEALGNYVDPSGSGSLDNPATSYNPTADGFLNVFGDGVRANSTLVRALESQPIHGESKWTVVNSALLADGPLFSLPSGQSKLAIGVEYRSEEGYAELFGVSSGNGRQSNKSAFAEISLPVVGKNNEFFAVRELSLSFSGRYEDFGSAGNSLNPRIGISWTPLDSAKIRATWGRSFKIPTLSDRDTIGFHKTSLSGGPLTDPQSPTGSSIVIIGYGVDPNLHEQKADSWTAGVDLTPDFLPNSKLSITYYSTVYEDKIGGVLVDDLTLGQERVWQDAIQRSPSVAAVNAICDSVAPSQRPNVCATPFLVEVLIDARTRNIARQINRGVDLLFNKEFRSNAGNWGLFLNGNYTLKNLTQLSATSPSVNFLDVKSRPVSKRYRGGVVWSRASVSAYGFVAHVPGYMDPNGGITASTPRPISSWTTADVGVSYRWEASDGWLNNSSVTINAANVFDKAPPFANSQFGYDPANADPYGRFVSLRLTKNW